MAFKTDFYGLDKKKSKMLDKMVLYLIKKLTIKNYSNLSNINIHYYLKLRIPIMHRHFFRKISQNQDYILTFCNDRRNPFHFACRQWHLYNIPQN